MPEYNEFRTGLTFTEVRHILKREAEKKYRKGEYMFITRNTVLGRWREIKLSMYKMELQLAEQFGE